MTGPSARESVTVDATVWAYTDYESDHLDLFYATNTSAPQWTLLTTLTPSQSGAQALSTSFVLAAGAELQAIRAVFRYRSSAGPVLPQTTRTG